MDRRSRAGTRSTKSHEESRNTGAHFIPFLSERGRLLVVQLFPRQYTEIMNSALPGGDLIDEGVEDLRQGRETIAALLVAIGSPRLGRLGIKLPDSLPEDPEHRLYALLAQDEPDSAHSRYNALIRRLVSFERAAECVSP